MRGFATSVVRRAILCLPLCLVLPVGAAFANRVLPDDVYPPPNAFAVPISGTITVVFEDPIAPTDREAFFDPSMFRVRGSLSGTLPTGSAYVTFDPLDARKVSYYNPYHPFKAGETITVEVNPTIVDITTCWSFVAEARCGLGEFVPWPVPEPPTPDPDTLGWTAGELGEHELKRIMFADFDGDQWVDALALTENEVLIFKNTYENLNLPLFENAPAWRINLSASPLAVLIEDLDLDGDPDLCFTYPDNYLRVFRNDLGAALGDFFKVQDTYLGPDATNAIRIEAWNLLDGGDVGQRGLPDVVVLGANRGKLLLLQNTGNASDPLVLSGTLDLKGSYPTSAKIGEWSGVDLTKPELIVAFRTDDPHIEWCEDLQTTPFGPLNCSNFNYQDLTEPASIRVGPILREGVGIVPERADFATYNQMVEPAPPEMAMSDSKPRPHPGPYDTLFIYETLPSGGGNWNFKKFDKLRSIRSLAIADFDLPSSNDNMGFVAGGEGGFQVIEDNSTSNLYKTRTPGWIIDIASADLNRDGGIDLGMIRRKYIDRPDSTDRIYFFKNASACTTCCPFISSLYEFPNTVCICAGPETLLVPLTPRCDFPITLLSIAITNDPTGLLRLIDPPAPGHTIAVGDTLWLQVGINPGPSAPCDSVVTGTLEIATPELTCGTGIRAPIDCPMFGLDPVPIDFTVAAGCAAETTVTLSSLNCRAVIDTMTVPPPFELKGGFTHFPVTLEAGDTLTGTIRFTAPDCGTWSDTLKVLYCGAEVEAVVAVVSGTGTAPDILSDDPISIGPLDPGVAGSNGFSTVNNTTCEQEFCLSLSPGTSPPFSIIPPPSCPITLGPGDSLIWEVEFIAPDCGSPPDTHSTWILVDFGNTSSCLPDSLAVTGSVCCPSVIVQPSEVVLEAFAGCTDSATVTLSSSECRAYVDSVAVTPPFTLAGCSTVWPDTLRPGEPESCTVRFTAPDCSTWSGELEVHYKGGNDDVVRVPLTGTGLPVPIFSKAGVIIGPVPPGKSGSAGFTIENNTNCVQEILLGSEGDTAQIRFTCPPDGPPGSPIILNPGESRDCEVEFDAPADACEPGHKREFNALVTAQSHPKCTDTLEVVAYAACPNLVITEFRITEPEPKARDPIPFTLTVECKYADYPCSFQVEVDVYDQTRTARVSECSGDSKGFARMSAGESRTWNSVITCLTSGCYSALAKIITPDPSEECPPEDPDGNEVWLDFCVGAELVVWPNPFTPNGDGHNDRVHFEVTGLRYSSPQVRIFSMDNRLLKKLTKVEHLGDIKALRWDGRDEDGHALPPGAYLYVFTDEIAGTHKGTVALAR